MNSHPYEFHDCGNNRRLENIGGVLVSRPAPAATNRPGLPPAKWTRATLSFDREKGWTGQAPENWNVELDGIRLGLRPGANGQVGIFPEHARVAERLLDQMNKRFDKAAEISILNLFAHTGLATLRLATRPGTTVTHVDSSGGAVRAARHNAQLSGMENARIRWIIEDVMKFCKKETKRNNRYNVILADPPAFGRGTKGEEWKLERDLGSLLKELGKLLDPNGILCLTCHKEGWGKNEVEEIMKKTTGKKIMVESERLILASVSGGQSLQAGIAVYGLTKEGPLHGHA